MRRFLLALLLATAVHVYASEQNSDPPRAPTSPAQFDAYRDEIQKLERAQERDRNELKQLNSLRSNKQSAEDRPALDLKIQTLQKALNASRQRAGQVNALVKYRPYGVDFKTVIELKASPPRDIAERQQAFAHRNDPASVAALAQRFFRIVDETSPGVGKAVDLYRNGRAAEALEAYRDFFFARLIDPEKFNVPIGAFILEDNPYASPRPVPATWLEDALNGIAMQPSRFVGKETVIRVPVGKPGEVNWADIQPTPLTTQKEPVSLEFARYLGRLIEEGSESDGLRVWLYDGYINTGESNYLQRYAEYSDDWAMNFQRDVDALPASQIPYSVNAVYLENVRFYPTLIPRQVCGFLTRLRAAALRHPQTAKLFPATTLARILLVAMDEYLSPNILVSRTARQNWNMMGLGFNVKNGMLLPELKPAQWAAREARREIARTYTFSILPDGGYIEYSDEGHQGVWMERVGDMLRLWRQKKPAWFTPMWEGELVDGYHQNALFFVRHLKPDGYRHRDDYRYAGDKFLGKNESIYGPESLERQVPELIAQPEVHRVLSTVFGDGSEGAPLHRSDVMPYLGEFILRGGWGKDDPFLYMDSPRLPNSNSNEECNGIKLHYGGRHLLTMPPVYPEGLIQNAHFKYVDNVGSKTEFLTFSDGKPISGRFHTSDFCDFAEGIYEGPYEARAGRPYRSVFRHGGQDLRKLDHLGDPPVTDIKRHVRQVFYLRKPTLWIIVDRIETGSKHKYEQPLELYTPVNRADWLRRANTPIPDGDCRVELDENVHIIRTNNPGWPNLSLHQFSSAPLHYRFDPQSQDLAHVNAGEIQDAEREWKSNRTELRDTLAFIRRTIVSWEGAENQLIVTAIEPTPVRAESSLKFQSTSNDGQSGFIASSADGISISFDARRSPHDEAVLRVGGSDGKKREMAISPQDHQPIQPVTFSPAVNVFSDSVDVKLASETPGTEIHYTLDGSDPTPSSPLFEGAVRLTQTTRVKAIAIRPGIMELPPNLSPSDATLPTWGVFTKQSPLNVVDLDKTEPGLRWEYVEGNQFALVANSEWIPSLKSGVTNHLFDTSMHHGGSAFVVHYRGLINVPADGIYTFHAPREIVYPEMEPGYDLRVFVDGLEWEPAARWHALGTWSIALKKGNHAFKVIFTDTRTKPYKLETWRNWPNPRVLWTGEVPKLEVSGPDLTQRAIPDEWLLHSK